MRYELTTIVADEATANPAPDLITTHGGRIIREDEIGQRRFAYPINKLTNGVYARFLMEVEPSSVQALDAALRRDGAIIRHLLVLQPRESLAPLPTKVEMSDADIDALGDVKEMQAAEAKALLRSKDGATAGQAKITRQRDTEIMAEKTGKRPVIVTDEIPETVDIVVDKTDEPPTGDVTAGEHAAVKDESGTDEATRQAALDEKLKSILGK